MALQSRICEDSFTQKTKKPTKDPINIQTLKRRSHLNAGFVILCFGSIEEGKHLDAL